MLVEEKSPYKIIIFLSLLLAFMLLGDFSYSNKMKSKELSKEDLAMREYMLQISKELGVTCNYCHNVKDYSDTSMKNHQIAKQHMRIVHLLNTEGFVGKNSKQVSCYMCHQGKAKFKYRHKKGDDL